MNNTTTMDDQDEIAGTKQYILSLCSAIGGLEEVIQADGTVGQVYCVGDEALACLRDLKKAIRVDSTNNERTVLKALVEYNVIETDIVPLILSFQKDRNEVTFRFILACVELLVPMTWPMDKKIDLEQDEKETEDPNLMQCYRKYKMDLLKPGVFETILALVMKSVRIPHRDRSIIDHTTIRLALYLFRNLTTIPDLNISQHSATPEQLKLATLQETLMLRYYESDVIEFLLTIASNSQRQSSTSEWNMLVLESIYNIIKHIDPKVVYDYKISQRVEREDLGVISKKLSNLLNEETKSKRQKTAYTPSRHNRFGGTYVLSWDDNKKKVSHKQVAGFADPELLVDGEKKENRVGMKRKLEDKTAIRIVYKNRNALMYLKQTVQAFIESCFNAFFSCITKDMQREDDKIVAADYSRYYYTMKWMLEYLDLQKQAQARKIKALAPGQPFPIYSQDDHDHKDFDFSLVASALDLKTVLFCLRHMRIKLDDKEWFDVQMAIDCFRQMLVVISMMAKSDVIEYQDTAEHIQSNLYYEQSHLDLLVEIIRKYKNQSKGYLKSVVRLTDVVLKLLDEYQKGKKMVFVRRTTKKQKKKKKPMMEGEEEEPLILEEEEEESETEEQARDRNAEYREQVFKFAEFEKKYISTDVMNAYLILLDGYKDLEPIYLMCITKMFHRIMVKRRAEFLLWKIPVLYLFNQILIDKKNVPPTAEFNELLIFIRYSLKEFFKTVKAYPLLMVEALIPNMKSDREQWESKSQETVARERTQRQQEEAYLNDVNYVPESLFAGGKEKEKTPEEQQQQADFNDIDEDMADYYFSAFEDKRREEETVTSTSNNDKEQAEDIVMNQQDQDESEAVLRENRENREKMLNNNNGTLDTEDYDNFDPYKIIDDDILGLDTLKRKTPPSTTNKASLSNDDDDEVDLELDEFEKEQLLSDMGVGMSQ